MYQILQIEDEIENHKTFLNVLEIVKSKANFEAEILAVKTVKEANEMLKKHVFDFVFSDIRLQGSEEDVFSLFEDPEIRLQNFKLVFLSQVIKDNFHNIISSPWPSYKLMNKPVNIEELTEFFKSNEKKFEFVNPEKPVWFQTRIGNVLIKPSEICWFSKNNDSTFIYTILRNEPFECNQTLAEVFNKINSDFMFRVFQSHVINIHFLRRINPIIPRDASNKDHFVVMERNLENKLEIVELELSRKLKESFEKKLSKW